MVKVIDDFKETLKKLYVEMEGKQDGYEDGLFSDSLKDPVLFVYGWCCRPCLVGQISASQGRNCLGSCCCFMCCGCCHPCSHAIVERQQIGGDGLVHSWARNSMCCFGTIQTAKKAGVKPAQLFMDAKKGAQAAKGDAQA